jgi:thiamine biosynthesis lipoprotein
VQVHPSTCALLHLARRLNTLTAGVFDPCLPSRPGRLQDIEVADEHVTCHAPVTLDFGGFAKGYAVDCAIEALAAHGCDSGLVNAGGDLRVFGSGGEPIFLRTPGDDTSSRRVTLTEVALSDAALAVSDASSRRRPPEHQGYYIRARASKPLVSNYAAVIAKQAVIADALAKCVLLCAEDVLEPVLRTFDARRLVA